MTRELGRGRRNREKRGSRLGIPVRAILLPGEGLSSKASRGWDGVRKKRKWLMARTSTFAPADAVFRERRVVPIHEPCASQAALLRRLQDPLQSAEETRVIGRDEEHEGRDQY